MKYCVRIALKGTTNNLLIVACQKCGVSIKPLEVLSQKQVLLCTSSIKNVYRMDHYYWKSFYFFFLIVTVICLISASGALARPNMIVP